MKKKEFRNIGNVSEYGLNEIGIFILQDLEKIGAEKAYEKIQNA